MSVYRVTLETVVYVEKASQRDALMWASKLRVDLPHGNERLDAWAEPASMMQAAADGWATAIPYGSSGDRTVEELLSSETGGRTMTYRHDPPTEGEIRAHIRQHGDHDGVAYWMQADGAPRVWRTALDPGDETQLIYGDCDWIASWCPIVDMDAEGPNWRPITPDGDPVPWPTVPEETTDA